MRFDLLVRGGTLVHPYADSEPGQIGIRAGRIVALLAPDEAAEADRVVEAVGRYVLPGLIDPHLHIGLGNGPADWQTETRSAAAGGLTTVFSFLMSGESYRPVIEEALRTAQASAHVDFGLHVVPCAPIHLEELEGYARVHGVTSFKYFTSFRGDEGAYLGVAGSDDGYLFDYLSAVARLPGALACVHPENIEIVWRLRLRLQEAGRDDLAAWDEARPDFVEAEAINRVLLLAERVGAPLYLVHVSSALALREIRAWRARQPESVVFVETCPHFLTHTRNDPIGSLGKINPPLRGEADREALWQALADGTVDTLGSDHVPRRRDRKSGSIWTASAGFPGTATILPVLLSEGVNRRGLPIRRVAEVCAANPARALGCYPERGSLEIGALGNLTIVDLDLERLASPEVFQSYADYSLYDGRTLRGWPVATIVRGEVVMVDGQVVSQPGFGAYVPRRVGP